MEKYYDKVLYVDIDDDKNFEEIVKALNCKTRRDILRVLNKGSLSIRDIAENLNVPLSSVSEHVSVLSKTQIVSVSKSVADRGNSKMVSRQYEKIELNVVSQKDDHKTCFSQVINVPIGSYSDFKVNKYCGMCGKEGYIGARDNPNCFYSPLRFMAQLIWLDFGYLEYKLPIDRQTPTAISVSLEICSEAPGYDESWKSEIYFEINGIRVCSYISPGDFGARKGIMTPDWWKDGTQYGLLIKLEVNDSGSYFNGKYVSNVDISRLNLKKDEVVTFRIGVDKNAKYCGGINIFGKNFGDYNQHIVFALSYDKHL